MSLIKDAMADAFRGFGKKKSDKRLDEIKILEERLAKMKEETIKEEIPTMPVAKPLTPKTGTSVKKKETETNEMPTIEDIIVATHNNVLRLGEESIELRKDIQALMRVLKS